MKRRALRNYLVVHIAVLAFALLFRLAIHITSRFENPFFGCLIHDRLFLYCPLCGGTRAVDALFRLDFALALRCNPLVVFLVAIVIVLDVIALIRILRGNEDPLPIPRWLWTLLLALLLAYAVLRNYLMIVYGYDPLGDLIGVWSSMIT